MKTGLFVLGNQLFDPKLLARKNIEAVFMREDTELCTHFEYHKLKIMLFLMAMRSHADELRAKKFNVTYQELAKSKLPYEKHLEKWIRDEKIDKLLYYEIEDKFFERRITALVQRLKIEVEVLRTPMFVTTREEFKSYLAKSKRPFMRTFYEQQRKRLKIMVDAKNEPIGGRWSFDELNRKPLPKSVAPPEPFLKLKSKHEKDVAALCESLFPDHPGQTENVWFATSRKDAHAWLEKFFHERFANFGPYEDALARHSDFVFHSVITPYLNTGLLTPAEVVQTAIRVANERKLNIASVEGFVRQIIGWREFVRGIYQNYSEKQDEANFFKHKRRLTKAWYDGTTGIEPLDRVIKKAERFGYAHHIERLMVAGNLMLLCEIEPRDAHKWFMEMFIDSSDWVMGPNVYGMGIFSDGGIFATKPYICGSNYYRKMGGYKKDDWCDGVDGLYWRFVEKHADYLAKNPRLSMMVRTVSTMEKEKKRRLFAAAKELQARITQ